MEGETALIYSAAYGHTGVAKLLLNHPKIDVNIQDNKKYTAFVHAAISGHNEIFELLFEQSKVDDIVLDAARNNADIHAYNKVAEFSYILYKAMEQAVIRGHDKIVEKLLNYPNIDIIREYFDTYVLFAVCRGLEDILKMLLEKGDVDINKKYFNEEYTLLIYAVEEGYAEIVRLLLKQPGININVKNAEGETALDCAIKKGRRKIIRLIQSKIGSQSQIQQFEFTDVVKESKPNHYKKINKRFIEVVSQGDINEMDTLLEEKNPNNGKILVNINSRDKNGDTALIIASDKGNLEAVRWLLEYKADLTLKDANGDNALIRGAEKGHFDVVEELLFRKANINSTGQHKKTALMAAAENGHIRVVKLLIKKRAKVTIKNDYDKTALDIVTEKMNKLNYSAADNNIYETIKKFLENQSKQFDRESDHEIKINNLLNNNWEVVPDKNYETDLKIWEKNDPVIYNKIQQLIEDIEIDPFR
eukprot:jgi/Orpsp1_1/1190003/evm.model.d7180000076047.1